MVVTWSAVTSTNQLANHLRRSKGQVKRDVAALGKQEYDLLIVGGGIFSACAAWDTAQRGLSACACRPRRLFCGHCSTPLRADTISHTIFGTTES
jgi:enhancing lycopene biosynthesis protein 2